MIYISSKYLRHDNATVIALSKKNGGVELRKEFNGAHHHGGQSPKNETTKKSLAEETQHDSTQNLISLTIKQVLFFTQRSARLTHIQKSCPSDGLEFHSEYSIIFKDILIFETVQIRILEVMW